MQNWKDLYKELGDKLTTIPGLKWVDLWHNQINFLDNEHTFPTPAVFLAFRSLVIRDASDKIQDVDVQVDVYLFYETFLDTFNGAYNQDGALEFLDMLTQIHALLHGSQGTHFQNMRRTYFGPVDTGNSGNLYLSQYACKLLDTSAQPEWGEGSFADLRIDPKDQDNGYVV